ncbi:MAG: CARDB domain-containing protein [Planctomycetota bacterium]|jgi:hypothetical protein
MKTTRILVILVLALGLVGGAAKGQHMLSGRVYEGQTGIEPPPLGDASPLAGVTVNLYGADDVRLMGTYITHTTTDGDGWYGLLFSAEVHAYDFYNIVAMTPAGYTSIGATSVSGTVRATDWIQYSFDDLAATTTGNKFWCLSETGPPENQPPVVFAGNDLVETSPIPLPYPVPLAGEVSDDGLPVGEPLVIEWSLVSGPGEVVSEDAANPETTAYFYAYGTYVLRLTAHDGEFEAFDDVIIEIREAAPELVCVDELIGVDINGSQPAGGVEPVAICWRITAGGADIGGTADQFYYAYAPDAAHGDFTAVVGWKGGVSRLTAHEWAKAGIMARQNLEPGSPYVMVVGTPGHGVALQGRDWPDGESWHVPVGLADWRVDETDTVWLRLDRVGNTITGSYWSTDADWPGGEHPGHPPEVWTASASHEVAFGDTQVGLATTSHQQGTSIEVNYTDLYIGPYVGPLILADPQLPEGPAGGEGYMGIREVIDNGPIGDQGACYASLASGMGTIVDYTASVLNIQDSGGNGHFGLDNPFGVVTAGHREQGAVDNLSLIARGTIRIPPGQGGFWTFGINSNDGFTLQLPGQNFLIGENGIIVNFESGAALRFYGGRTPADTLGVIELPPGVHTFWLTFHEGWGGAAVEFFAAMGAYTSWDAGVFSLVGGPDGLQLVAQEGEPEFFEEVPAWRMPELAVTSLTVEPERANPGQWIALSATVSSAGNGNTGPATLIFTVDDTEIHRASVGAMVAGEQVEVRTTWRSEDPGRHPVVAQLELGPRTFDWDPFNNTRRAIARISGEARPILELEVGEIDFNAMQLIPGQSYVIPVKFRNPGFSEISYVLVAFYIDGEQVSTGAIRSLSSGREQELSFTWSNVTRGEHAIAVKMTLPDGFPDPVHQSVKGWNVVVPDMTMLYSTADKHKWSSVGPRILDNDWAGRISCFAYHPSNPSIMYAGSVGNANTDDTAGGVWKTTNGGLDWFPVGDKLDSMKVRCIAVDDKAPANVYIGTDGYGIWKSIDSGQNWYPFASRQITGHYVTELIIRSESAPTSPRVLIYAATNQGVLRYTSDSPSAKTSTATDWPNIKTGIVADLAVHPIVRSTVFATLENEGRLYRTEKGITAKEETPGGGHDWTLTGNNLPVVTGWPGIRIDIYRSYPAYVYAGITSPRTGYHYAIYRSNDWGNNFQLMKEYTDKELPAVYNAFIRVHPNLLDMVYFGGVHFWKWSKYNPPEGQTSWTYKVDLSGAADLKALEFPPSGAPSVFYLACDQGMFRYTPSQTPKKETVDSKNYGLSGDTCEARNNNLRVSQMYDFDLGTSIPPRILAGTQDTGNIMYKGSSKWAFLHAFNYGDGLYSLIAPSNNDVLYIQFQHMDSTARSPNAGKDWKKIIANNGLPTDSAGNLLCNKYIIVDPHYPNTVLAACGSGDPVKGGEVYATTDAHLGTKCTWTPRGPFGTNVKGDVSRIVIQSNTTHWYAGTSHGQIWSTSSKVRGTWSLIDSHPDQANVRSMAFSPSDPNVLYVLYSGGDEHRRVQRLEWTAQGGWNGSWIKDNLDVAKVVPIVICGDAHRSDIAYVGTKHGVFCWDGARPMYDSWHSYNDGFPLTKVNDLKVGPDMRLYAATMGRGAWSVITGP